MLVVTFGDIVFAGVKTQIHDLIDSIQCAVDVLGYDTNFESHPGSFGNIHGF